MGVDDPVGSGTDSGGLIRKANNATDKEDNNLIYDWECFRKDKARYRYDYHYSGHRIIVEQGINVANLDARVPREWVVLDD